VLATIVLPLSGTDRLRMGRTAKRSHPQPRRKGRLRTLHTQNDEFSFYTFILVVCSTIVSYSLTFI
jgi:hypothetical protein